MWCETAYARDGSASATKIIAGKGNIAPKLELSNSSKKPLGNIKATDRDEKSVTIDSNSAQNATESNAERNAEAGIDIITELSKYRVKNKDKVVLATLNINSIRNKFSSLLKIISNNIDVLVIQETKIDASFPDGQFLIPGYRKPYRRDRNCHVGGILVYVKDDIPSKEVNTVEIDGKIFFEWTKTFCFENNEKK